MNKNTIKKLLANKKRAAIVGIIIIILVFAGFKIFGKNKDEPELQTSTIEAGNIVNAIMISGQILNANNTSISTQASGRVTKIHVNDGDQVKTDQIIAEVELDLIGKQSQSQAYASYLAAKNTLVAAETKLHTLQSSLFAKNQILINDAVARELDITDPTYIQQSADWLAAEEGYTNQQNVITQAKTALTTAWYSYQDSRSTIIAPTSGTITSITIAEGMNLNNTDSRIRVASIKSAGQPLASFNASEIDVSIIEIDQKATVTLDSISDKTFTGKVVSIDRTGSTTSGVTNYPVIIQLDTDSDQILPNMAATANIIIESKNNILVVPLSAINFQGDQAYIQVMKKNQPQNTLVEVGISNDTQAEIVSGLNEGDIIITGTINGSTSSQPSGSLFSAPGGGGGTMRMIH